MATKGKAGKRMHGVSRVYGLESHLFRILKIGKETNRPKKFIYFLLRTEEYFSFYRTLNRVDSIIIDLIILARCYIYGQFTPPKLMPSLYRVDVPSIRQHPILQKRWASH